MQLGLFNGKRALVVEDQEMFREAVVFELASLGFDVVAAKDGKEGFETATRASFDLIISDIKMPNWDGKRFLEELRRHPQQTPPFVFMTGFADIAAVDAFEMGADAYLAKPLPAETLAATIETLLQPPATLWLASDLPPPGRTISLRLQSAAAGQPAFAIGRRGFALRLEPNMAPTRAGERVQFSIEFADGPLTLLAGRARVAWLRRLQAGGSVCGLELELLQEPGRAQLIALIAAQAPVASIPSLKAVT